MVEESKPVVTITGISGYVGSQTAMAFLRDGSFRVRGTVRSKTNAAKIDPLRRAFGDQFAEIELVEADLMDEESLRTAIAGSTYVAHTASPFLIDGPSNEDFYIRPAVDGTLSVMRACQAAKVRRVVLTSSCAAVTDVPKSRRPDVFNESHWSDPSRPEGMDPYSKSKVMAERAAWDFLAYLPDEEKFELSVINPGLIMGPPLIGGDFASGKVMKSFLLNGFPGGSLPRTQLMLVDVREVARAHVEALKRDGAQGKRFILVSGSLWFREMADILREHFGPLGYKVPSCEAKFCLVRFLGVFSTQAKLIKNMWNLELPMDNTRSREILGIEYRPLRESFIEMGMFMIEDGQIPDKRSDEQKAANAGRL